MKRTSHDVLVRHGGLLLLSTLELPTFSLHFHLSSSSSSNGI